MCLELVLCDKIYWEFVRKLRNNKKTNIGFIENKIITVIYDIHKSDFFLNNLYITYSLKWKVESTLTVIFYY